MPTLVSSIDQIDTQWMQSVFSAAGMNLPKIKNLKIEPLGHGNTGSTVKVSVAYDSELPNISPASVVCKLHPAEPAKFEMTKQHGVFVVESNALQLLAGGLDVSIPALYFVDVAQDGGEFNLVCEDLSVFCELGDQIKGCSIQEAKAAVTELAKLHRQFWNEPLLEDLHWVKPRMRLPENVLELIRERLTRILSEEQHDIVQQGVPLVFEWLERPSSNRTLIHTDCRVDNILFDNRDRLTPKAYLIDFALTNVGDASADLAYFLTSSVAPVDRLACEMDLIKIHTQEIAKKDPEYTFEKAVIAYRENIVSSLYLTLIAALGMPENPYNEQLFAKLFERNCAAVKHWAL